MLTLTKEGSLDGLIYFDLSYVDEAQRLENTALTLHNSLSKCQRGN